MEKDIDSVTDNSAAKKKLGRPKIQIDQKSFEELCKMQCTELEICGFFGCCDETLNSWCKKTYKKTFQECFEVLRQGGKASLRRSQWLMAEHNAAMAIFLGKNYLGQSDDPLKYKKDETTEDKLGRFIDVLTDVITSDTTDATDDTDDGSDDDEE